MDNTLPRPTLIPLRAYDARLGIGETVAVFFRVPVQHVQHPTCDGDQHGGGDQAAQAVGAES